MYKKMIAGMASGALGSLVFNPIELIKTRQQGAAGGGDGSFKYSGPLDGLKKLHASEGVRGMWRGTGVSMLRSALVTGPHLTTYSTVKEVFIRREWLADAPPLHMFASLAGGLAGISCNHPLDLVRNRLYNQPRAADGRGLLYDGAVDCFRKVIRTDGLPALYRGFGAHYIRVGPHYVITFTLMERIKRALDG